ncbi:MAG TPA: DUF1549 and DUF1553 domain-containing protein, partial [Planctomycetota bacterium]|nr:DUF1549 and DUF1553 domain-containing protein [Planctomycetota bacterium]
KRADDFEYLRRVSLDLLGEIPSLEEIERFESDPSPDKRAALVETLLKSPRYAIHWGDIWGGILLGLDHDPLELVLFFKARARLIDLFEKNLPYDEFAREVISARGAVYPLPGTEKEAGSQTLPEEGLSAYLYRLFQDNLKDLPLALAGRLTRAFMGIQIQCAQCHDHPFDRWTQEEFYGMASFFTELTPRRLGIPDPRPAEPGKPKVPLFYFDFEDQPRPARARPAAPGPGMDLTIPGSKKGPTPPSFLGTRQGAEPGTPRRAQFARLMTERTNLQFAKMCVNRYWAHFFGAGIVDPPDDFSERHKPSFPVLLDELARDFIDHRYDLHWLIRTLTASEAYGLSSRAASRDGEAEKLFGLARIRALSPEQILGSLLKATRLPEESVPGDDRRQEEKRRILFGLVAQFRSAFGDDEDAERVEFAGTLPSALLLMNGPFIGQGTNARTGQNLGRILADRHSPQERVRGLFLTVLSRPPTEPEAERWLAFVERARGNSGYEDLFWTLLNTSEFLFNH